MRKKNSQVSNLHLYHHISTPLFSWVMVKFAAGKTLFPPADRFLCNCCARLRTRTEQMFVLVGQLFADSFLKQTVSASKRNCCALWSLHLNNSRVCVLGAGKRHTFHVAEHRLCVVICGMWVTLAFNHN